MRIIGNICGYILLLLKYIIWLLFLFIFIFMIIGFGWPHMLIILIPLFILLIGYLYMRYSDDWGWQYLIDKENELKD